MLLTSRRACNHSAVITEGGKKEVKKILFGLRTILHLIQIFPGKTKVAQNSCQGTLGNVLAAMMRNRGEGFIFGVPPDFVRTWGLANKLAAQPAELLAQYAVGHTGTRRSA